MSLLKWTLALAGTAMGLRYMSDRHRRRLAGDDGGTQSPDGGWRAAQTDRDGGRDGDREADRDTNRPGGTPWTAPQGGGGNSLATGAGAGGGGGTGLPGSPSQDDLSASDSDMAPGSPANRF